MASACSYLGHQ